MNIFFGIVFVLVLVVAVIVAIQYAQEYGPYGRQSRGGGFSDSDAVSLPPQVRLDCGQCGSFVASGPDTESTLIGYRQVLAQGAACPQCGSTNLIIGR